tara:strand:- start:2610 stop:2795 length:186 start_codon:yes stop_codon:yes gene_type:complete
MNRMPLDSQLDPEKIEAYILIHRMLQVLQDPTIDDLSKEALNITLKNLVTTYLEQVDPTEH